MPSEVSFTEERAPLNVLSSGAMLDLSEVPESNTAEEAVAVVGSLARRLAIPGEVPSLRTLRLWRSRQLLSRSGRRLTRRNLLEILGIMRLRGQGVTMGAAAERCAAIDEERLLSLVTVMSAAPPTTLADFAEVTLVLLARSVLEQYHLVTQGAIVGHSDSPHTAITNTPTSLKQAAARLGRLYLEEGREDRAASLHMLLSLCTQPLGEWAPAAVAGIADAADAVLIDPFYRVPTEECEAIALRTDGVNMEDLIERRLHRDLGRTLSKLEEDAAPAYTVIRGFIGRHPLATGPELQTLYAKPELPTPAVEFVRSLYAPVHASFALHGLVHRCGHCHAVVDRDGRCTLQGCREDHPQGKLAEPVPLDGALVARPEVLRYWADPAREELRIFDALTRAGVAARLYPHCDRCDVAVADAVGVDVKDYRDPVQLARRLNRGMGGLAHYRRKVLAVADRRARYGDYVERLREQLMPEYRELIDVWSVRETIARLVSEYGRPRRRRARQA
jgi:hypothetical protein